MKKYCLNLANFILIFLFSIFALSNIGFIFKLPINYAYIILSLFLATFYLFKTKKFAKKFILISIIFILSFIFANFFIDTSFDGRCYHFATENLLKLGFNPIYDNIKEFANSNNIYYNLLFSGSYPNAIETIRANFYLLFQNMESSKIVNYLLLTAGLLYSNYFFLNKLNKINSAILSFATILCSVSICQVATKMADFSLYYIFILQLFSLILIDKKEDVKENSFVFATSSILALATKYTGLLNTAIIFSVYFIYKLIKKEDVKHFAKITLITFIGSLILTIQPYITNTIKFKNPFYPSIGHNKLDFMTKQNPLEFNNKPYIYKFTRSMFSSASDSRQNNPQTPKLYWKAPFTAHYDMPYVAEDVRINGFGHLFSGIFLLSVIFTIYCLVTNKNRLAYLIIILSVFLNPICWWARFVPQLHLLPILNCYSLRKNKWIFYILSILLIINGLWIYKENFSTSGYKTYVMSNFYNDLYDNSQIKQLKVYIDKTPYDEDDTTILFRMKEYGINYTLTDKATNDFKTIHTDCTITKSYKISY